MPFCLFAAGYNNTSESLGGRKAATHYHRRLTNWTGVRVECLGRDRDKQREGALYFDDFKMWKWANACQQRQLISAQRHKVAGTKTGGYLITSSAHSPN